MDEATWSGMTPEEQCKWKDDDPKAFWAWVDGTDCVGPKPQPTSLVFTQVDRRLMAHWGISAE
jgi:hypothetical protein